MSEQYFCMDFILVLCDAIHYQSPYTPNEITTRVEGTNVQHNDSNSQVTSPTTGVLV